MAELTGSLARPGPAPPGDGPDVREPPRAVPRCKMLLFRAGGELFALALERVREVCPRAAITRVPRAPAQVLGIMNLRGRAITLVDLPRCLGLPAGAADPPHVIVLDLRDPELAVGVLAEGIHQVAEVELRGTGGGSGPDGFGGAEGPELVEVSGRVATVLDPVRALAGTFPGVGTAGAGDRP